MSDSPSLAEVFRHPSRSAEAKESSALLVGAAAFVIGALVGLFVFWDQDVPIAGRGSIGIFAAVGGAVAAIAAFVFGCAVRRSRARTAPGYRQRLHWFDVAALALALGVIALLAWTGLASLLSQSFVGALVYGFPAAVLGGVALALSAYMAYLSAVNLTPMLLSLVLAMFLAVGALASMLSATDPLWWQKNLSTLGISDDISALAFNLTLIIAGVMVTTIAHYATAFLPADSAAERRGRNLVRLGLVVIGILLACVGIFPVDEYLGVHNLSATGMAIVYVAMVLSLPALLPTMPKVFVVLGFVYVGVIVVLAAFFVSGYYNLTAVELIVAVLVFSWVILFLRNTGAVEQSADDRRPSAEGGPVVTKTEAVP
ncbi:DUF998 domain-containing protein [Agromyces sp. CCNWLW203]|uniref:DUF998 domain-containing protein n=1 Tax=Agromyces sp. CCNWLW203 TaxID=3112842 RepID=UPI002F96E218